MIIKDIILNIYDYEAYNFKYIDMKKIFLNIQLRIIKNIF